MYENEVRTAIRRASRRRHRATTSLTRLLKYPHTNAKKMSQTRAYIIRLGHEIDDLMGRL